MQEFQRPDNVDLAFELSQGRSIEFVQPDCREESSLPATAVVVEVEAGVGELGLHVESLHLVRGRSFVCHLAKIGGEEAAAVEDCGPTL